MKFIIIGSGGCVCTPKPCCQCAICVEAREKGYPYARCGCSLYLEDIALLVDTPEDIAIALNNSNIKAVDTILYSHWDPDHTLGMRVVEQLRLEWLDFLKGIKPNNPIAVYAQPDVMEDLKGIRSKYGSLLGYYEGMMGLVQCHSIERQIEIADIRITLIQIAKEKAVTVFVFESNGKKLIYAPCDCIPFPDDEILEGADLLVTGNTYVGNILKNGNVITDDHPLHKELYSFEDVLEMQNRLKAKRLVVTHLEEDWGKSFDDYKKLEKNYSSVRFAFDGMTIEL